MVRARGGFGSAVHLVTNVVIHGPSHGSAGTQRTPKDVLLLPRFDGVNELLIYPE
jgi:hypothetical protein